MATIENGWNIVRDFTMIPNDIVRSPRFTPRAFRVLAYLMSHAEGWRTSTERIADAIGMSTGTVKSAVRDLVETGYLVREQEHGEDGQFGATVYRLIDPSVGQNLADGATSENDAKAQRDTVVQKTDGGKTDGGNLSPLRRLSTKEDQGEEDQKNPPTPQGGQGAAGGFEEFWARYPRKVAKPTAERAYRKALKRTDHDTIMDGLARSMRSWAVEGRDKTKIPHASTWLNQDRWGDEETTAADMGGQETALEVLARMRGQQTTTRWELDQ